MKLLDWLRGPEETQKSRQSKDDLDRVLKTLDDITDTTSGIDPEKLRRKRNGS